ncbi:DUF6491 family protein [Sphingomonas sp. DT-207]|uniref:DUF6491 family protein n=1 Tax=Sphingomonas sp. DT-207 TaxID=3396167 RepID=UPI003F1DE2FE
MRTIWLLLAALAPAGCAAPPTANTAPQSGRSCFWGSQVSGFSDAGADKALVRIGTRETWELTLSGGCPDVDWAMRIGIRSRGGDRICTGVDAELLVPGASGSGFQRCLVRGVRKLSPEEAAAARGTASGE